MLAWPSRLVALAFFALPVSAQNSVQLMLSGEVRSDTGSAVDVEIAAKPMEGIPARSVVLHVTLLPRTSALDLALLLDARLSEAKIRHVAPAPASERTQATLFVEDVSRILVRVSDGLGAAIGLPLGGPASAELLAPLSRRGKGRLTFHGLTHDSRMHQRGTVDFGIDLDAETHATLAVERLSNACAEAHWLSERPTHETWRPALAYEGLDLVGTSFTLDSSAADWGLELRLP
jgi:hypothetical protein